MATTTAPETTKPAEPDTESWYLDGPYLNMKLPPDWVEFINRLLADTSDSPELMFRKALGLYRFAVNARKEGKGIGSFDPESGMVDTEMIL